MTAKVTGDNPLAVFNAPVETAMVQAFLNSHTVKATAAKVMDFALYSVRFSLAAGAIVFGLIQLLALSAITTAIGISAIGLGTAGLYHMYRDLTNGKADTAKAFQNVHDQLDKVEDNAKNIEDVAKEQAVVIKIVDEQADQILQHNKGITDHANHAQEALENGKIEVVKKDLKEIVIRAKDQKETIKEMQQGIKEIKVKNKDIQTENQALTENAKKAKEEVKNAEEAANLQSHINATITGAAAVFGTAIGGPLVGAITAAAVPSVIQGAFTTTTVEVKKEQKLTGFEQLLIFSFEAKRKAGTLTEEEVKQYQQFAQIFMKDEKNLNEANQVANFMTL